MELRDIERNDGITQVALVGSLDMIAMQKIDVKFQAYTASRRQPTIVDMSEVDFIASLGMSMLISCSQALKRHGAKMVLLNPQSMVEEALKTAGVDQAVPIVKSVDEALAVLGS